MTPNENPPVAGAVVAAAGVVGVVVLPKEKAGVALVVVGAGAGTGLDAVAEKLKEEAGVVLGAVVVVVVGATAGAGVVLLPKENIGVAAGATEVEAGAGCPNEVKAG